MRLKILLATLFLLFAPKAFNPNISLTPPAAYAAIAYDAGDVTANQLDPYLPVYPENTAPVTCVAFISLSNLSGAQNVANVENDPPSGTWTKQTDIVFGGLTFEAWTAVVTDASANVWAYFEGAGAGLDGSGNNTQCYTGVAAIGTNDTASGTSTAPSIALTTQDPDNFVVSGFAFIGSQTWTADTGNLRDNYDGSEIGGQQATAVVDNTAASASSVTTSATLSGSDSWAAIAIELRSTLGAAATRRPIAPMIFQ
jgi:hypothetical protein